MYSALRWSFFWLWLSTNINVDELTGERGVLLTKARHRRLLGWILAGAAGAERIVTIFVHNATFEMVGTICWLLSVVFVTFSQLRSVLRQRQVTGETICMAVSVYLLMGFTWAFLYAFIIQCQSGTVCSSSAAQMVLDWSQRSNPHRVTLQASYAAVSEGITGQFYLAILVARLVGMQMTQSRESAHEG